MMKQAEGKVRILADVSPEIREKLDKVCRELELSRKDFIQKMIEEQYSEHVERDQ